MKIQISTHDAINGGPEWIKQQMRAAGMQTYPYTQRALNISEIEIEGVPIENKSDNQERETKAACA